MKPQEIIGKKWDLYINGWLQYGTIIFLPDGKLSSNGTEGFARWEINNNNLVELYDEQNQLCYSLKHIVSASILMNTQNHRIKNNDLFLAQKYSCSELAEFFPNNELAQQVANKVALYKSNHGDVWGKMFFGIDGAIYHYHNPNETFWNTEDDSLKLYNKSKQLTCQQKAISYNNSSASQVIKQVSLNHIESKNTHYLDFLQFQPCSMTEPTKFLSVDACFSNRSDTLLVIFNSAGGEYNGKTVNYEFYHIPNQFAVDYIRLSQSSPTRVYLDDFEKIESLININDYKKIVFLGMSIGGYASIWFAETLARKNRNIEYSSISVQPLSDLSQKFADLMRMKYRDGYRAKTLTDNLIEEYEAKGLTLELSKLLKEPLDNVTHYIAYDALNDAEKESAGKLISSRVLPAAFSYACNHAEGCGRIYNSGFLENIFRKILITQKSN